MPTSALMPMAFLFLWGATPELPTTCPTQPQPSVVVSALLPGHSVSHDKSRAELGAMIGKKSFPGFYTQGVTDVTYGSRMRLKMATARLADGRWCASPRAVEVDFGLTSPAQVHIASEISFGSCRFETVLAHEKRHVEIAMRAVVDGVEDVRTALSSMPVSPVLGWGSDEAAATSALQAAIQSSVDEATEARLASAEMENALIDTRASYEELKNQCLGSSE